MINYNVKVEMHNIGEWIAVDDDTTVMRRKKIMKDKREINKIIKRNK